MFREMIEDKFAEYLTDFRFHGHLTVYKGVEANEEMKERQEIKSPLMQAALGSNLKDFGEKETKGGVMKA